MRRREVLPVVLAAALAAVGLASFRSPSGRSTPTPLPTPFPEASGQAWKIVGAISAMSGQFWSIAGVPVRITDSTRIQGDVPIAIGTTVEVSGVVAPDGTRLAMMVNAGTASSSAATPVTAPSTAPTSLAPASPLVPTLTSPSNGPSPATTTLPQESVPPTPTVTALPREALRSTLDDLTKLRATVTGEQKDNRLAEASRHVSDSLDPSLWVDAAHVQRPVGEKVFNENKVTVSKLSDVMRDQKAAGAVLVLQGFVDRVRDADRRLVSVAIEEAAPTDASQAAIGRARDELVRGDSDATVGHSDAAIDHYLAAWKQLVQNAG